MADLTTTIENLAANPAEAESDGLKVKAQPIPDVIAADRYLKANAAASKKGRGLRFSKMIPPGQIGSTSANQGTV